MTDIKRVKAAKIIDKFSKYVFFISALFSVLCVFAILGYILAASFPAFAQIGFFNFIFGTEWVPSAGKYGIFNMIVSSFTVTLGALLIGGTGGVFTAIFLAKFCPPKLKVMLNAFINLLAGIPSIIFGFFGTLVIVPLLSYISPLREGKGNLACSIVLALMIAPTVVNLAKTNIEAQSKAYYEGALALGVTHEQAVFKVTVPAAKSGIITALVLGVGRAIGEATAVYFVAGNSAFFNILPFGYMRTLTVNIILEMGYATGLHRTALIATGCVLLFIILAINIIFNFTRGKSGNKKGKKDLKPDYETKPEFKKNSSFSYFLKIAAIAFAALICFALVALISFILYKGLPQISWDFLFGESRNSHRTLLPAFAVTPIIILITLGISLPLGIFAAIYMTEYAKPGSKVVKGIRVFVETLSGIPSIVFGLFGMLFFCETLNLGYSIIAGALTLVIVVLPTIIRSTEEAIMNVPVSLREGSLGLGATKLRTIFKIVVKEALPGIFSAVVLTVGRIVGETAALLYTMGNSAKMPKSLLSYGNTFAIDVWIFSNGKDISALNMAYGTAAVLLIFVLALNVIAFLIERRAKKA